MRAHGSTQVGGRRVGARDGRDLDGDRDRHIPSTGTRSVWAVPMQARAARWTASVPAAACAATDDCSQCHGGFLASPYRSCVGGSNNAAACTADSQCPGGTCAAWSGPLHNVHRNNMLGAVAPNPLGPGRCNICHIGSSKTAASSINESDGTTGLRPDLVHRLPRTRRGPRDASRTTASTRRPPTARAATAPASVSITRTAGSRCAPTATRMRVPANFTPAGEHVHAAVLLHAGSARIR